MKIKIGSIEYFSLLGLQDKLRSSQYDKFDLITLDKLRYEVELKIKEIEKIKK